MQPSFVFVTAHYPEFLQDLYAGLLGLEEQPYATQLETILDTGFGNADGYRDGIRHCGCPADIIISNADALQAQWAAEHGITLDPTENIHDRRRRIVMAQVAHWRPDVLYVFEWTPLGDAFLARVKQHTRLLVGQIASPLRPDRTYEAYDLMFSSLPNLVEYFRGRGLPSEYVRLAFDTRALTRLEPHDRSYDVTFVGGFAPSHPDRPAFLERLLQELDVAIFGYGWEKVAADSPIRAHHHGTVWGWKMFTVLHDSRVTLNLHARIETGSAQDNRLANNLQLYEATGVGTCLVTEDRDNLKELFEPQREVATFADVDECIERVHHYLSHEDQCRAVAAAGQQRTLREHTHLVRMAELLDIIRGWFPRGATPRRPSHCTGF